MQLLVRLFEARHDPIDNDERTADALYQEVLTALDEVASLDDDRVIRRLLGIVLAILRTNFFQQVQDRPEGVAVVQDRPARGAGDARCHGRGSRFS